MMGLIGFVVVIGAYLLGVCRGAAAVEEVRGELRLPDGWWVVPAAAMGGLMMAAIVIWMGK